MSHIAKLFLAQAAQVSNEDIGDATFNDLAQDRAPAAEETAAPVEAAAEAPAVVEETPVVATEDGEAAPAAAEEVPAEAAPVEETPAADETVEEVKVADLPEVTDEPADEYSAECGCNSDDYVAASSELAGTREAAAQMDGVAAGLTEVRDTVNAVNAQGGITQEALPFLQHALEAYTGSLDYPRIALGVSQESFEAEDAPLRILVDCTGIESLLNDVTGAIEMIRGEVVSSESAVEDAIKSLSVTTGFSFEDIEGAAFPTAGADADTLALARADDGGSQALTRFGELNTAGSNVQQLIEDVNAQNELGGLSNESLAFLSLAVEAYTRDYGLPELQLVPGLESLTPEGRTVVSTEGIGDLFSMIKKGVGKAAKAVTTAIGVVVRALNTLWPRALARLEKVVAQAKDTKGKISGTVKIGSIARTLHIDGKMPSPAELEAALVPYCGLVQKMVGPYNAAALDALLNNSRLYNKIPLLGKERFQRGLDNLANGFKDPRSTLSAADLKVVIPGVGPAFVSWPSNYRGDNASGKKLEAIIFNNLPNGFGPWNVTKKAPKADSLPAMTQADIQKAGGTLIAAMKAIDVRKIERRGWQESFAEFNHEEEFANGWVAFKRILREEFDLSTRAVMVSFLLARQSGTTAARQFLRVVNAVTVYAERSLKLAEKASTESLEEPMGAEDVTGGEELSFEGDKALKSGVKVKFSHGHGKIAKIFTAPFLFGGKHHTASKDDPRYLVKHDKGGHQSIHKGSALKIV